MADTPPTECEQLVSAGWIVTLDDQRRIFEPGGVAIDGNRITWVGDSRACESIKAGTRIARPRVCCVTGLVIASRTCFSHS